MRDDKPKKKKSAREKNKYTQNKRVGKKKLEGGQIIFVFKKKKKIKKEKGTIDIPEKVESILLRNDSFRPNIWKTQEKRGEREREWGNYIINRSGNIIAMTGGTGKEGNAGMG